VQAVLKVNAQTMHTIRTPMKVEGQAEKKDYWLGFLCATVVMHLWVIFLCPRWALQPRGLLPIGSLSAQHGSFFAAVCLEHLPAVRLSEFA